jgi:hypothetical protein
VKRTILSVALGVLAGIVAAVGTLAVAVAGFTLSFDAIKAVGIASRVNEQIAWLLPISIDGAMAVATVTAIVMKRLGHANWYPWLVVLVGAAISVACNGAHSVGEVGHPLQLPTQARYLVSAIPAVMLALSVHLLVTLVEAFAESRTGAEAVPAEERKSTAEAPAEVTPEVVPVPLVAEVAPLMAEVPSVNGKSKGRSPEEWAAAYEELRSVRPGLKQKEYAVLLGISDRHLREVLTKTAEAEGASA